MKPPTRFRRGLNSAVGEHARPGRCGPRRAASVGRVILSRTLETFRCVRVFREGAENGARGGRAPRAVPELGLKRPEAAAFTFVELLVVLAVLLLGAMLLAPALARTQPDSRSVRCLNNSRQLTRAWLMYASDNNDKLATSFGGLSIVAGQPVWAYGWMDWATSSGNTNTVLLSDPQFSMLAPYSGQDASLFKCPADRYLSAIQRAYGWRERVRSISLNVYAANANIAGWPNDPALVQVTKLTGLLNPKPAETWVSLDEHPDSINDGQFFAPGSSRWFDLPASYHDGGAGVAFADGRAEIHRWQSSVLKVAITTSSLFAPFIQSTDADYLWLRSHTPRQPGMN